MVRLPETELERVAPEAAPGVRIVGVAHERVELAPVVRAVLETVHPDTVAVELPASLSHALERSVRRLPRVTAVVLSGDDHATVWFAAPGDPLVEAARWALEAGRRLACVDLDTPYAERHHDPLPDPWAAWRIGPGAYLERLREAAALRPASPADALREQGMARALLDETGAGRSVVAVVGAAHARRVAERVASGAAAVPLARRPAGEVTLYDLAGEDLAAALPDPPLLHAVWELVRGGAPPEPVPLEAALARPVDLVRDGYRLLVGERPEDLSRRRGRIAAHAARAAAREVAGYGLVPDRARLAAAAWRIAAGSWERLERTPLAAWQRRLFFDFARRLARVRGLLVAGLVELVEAARAVADDNLAWEVYEALRTYPWQQRGAAADLPTVRVDGDELRLPTRTIRFRRRFFRVKARPVPVRPRPEGGDPATWLEALARGEMVCSYPPEDVAVEDYGRYLRERARSLLAARRERSEPFLTGMRDGIDLRETLRRWHEGRIWVREAGRAPGEAGSVVVIFDPDPDDRRYPFRMTWHGEHDQESDMAFYATDPARAAVGPGILRATYGGFMLTHPPRRVYDVWSDPDYAWARSKEEVLLAAAVDYSTAPVVVHVGPRPPSPRLVEYATRQRKRIVHVPIASLSPPALARLRRVHLLSGPEVRRWARDWIG